MTNRSNLYLLVVAIVAVATLAFAWIGWLDSDDKNHLVGAFGWYQHFPYVGETHAALRHTIAVPVGMSFRLFGISEWSLIIPNIIQYLGIIWITFVVLKRRLGDDVALVSCLILVTVPMFPIFASVVFTEITELFWVALSFWLFDEASSRERKTSILLAAGAAAGLGWLTRETTAALLLLYGVLFLVGYGIERRYYWVMAGGFLTVVGAEALYMYLLTDDPLFRYQVVISKQGNIPYKGGLEGDVFNRIGNVSAHPLLDPFLVLYANHEFGLLFYAAIPAIIWCWSSPGLSTEQRNTLRALIAWLAIWFIFVSAVLTNLHQRYYSISAYVAAILVAVWLVHGVRASREKIAGLLLAGLLATNLLAIYIDNRNPLFGERALVEFTGSTSEPVYTDGATSRRALFFLKIANLDAQVHGAMPPPGALFLYNPNRARNWTGKNAHWKEFQPDPGWQIVWSNSEQRKLPGILLEKVGLAEHIPASIYRRLNMPNLPVVAYRTGKNAADSTANSGQPN